MMILHALPIRSYPLNRHDLFRLVQESRRRGQIGHEYRKDNTPCQTNGAKDQKDVLPLCEARVDMSDGVAQETTKDAGNAVEAVVCYETERLFVLLVVHGLHWSVILSCLPPLTVYWTEPFWEGEIERTMMSTNPGLTTASTTPRRNRFAAMPAKFVHAGVVIMRIPQMIAVVPMNLPTGRRWSRYPAGYCAKRYP